MKVNFVQYVSIITLTKEELQYDKLSHDDKKIVDLTRGTRDQFQALNSFLRRF